MQQPEKTGSGVDPITFQPVDYYENGFEKGQLYLFNPLDFSLLGVEEIYTEGIYDFQEGDFTNDFRMIRVCGDKFGEVLTGFPGVKVTAFEDKYSFLVPKPM